MNREEIEAAAKRHGLRVTRMDLLENGGDVWRVWFGKHKAQSYLSDRRSAASVVVWEASTRSHVLVVGGTLDEALAAIAADIDEIRSVRDPACPVCGCELWVSDEDRRCCDCVARLAGVSDRTVAEREEIEAAGYARCKADVVAWLKGDKGPGHVNHSLAYLIEEGHHVGAADTGEP